MKDLSKAALKLELEKASGEPDFNFYRFLPGDPGLNFTPYVTFGAGIFNYDPYAYLADEKYFLRPLGTEGQGSPLYPDRKQYSAMAISVPLGVGVKYSLNERLNIGFEVLHRFTNTDYLDDVSTNYVDQTALLNARGQTAVDFAWRGDEVGSGLYPAAGTSRGSARGRGNRRFHRGARRRCGCRGLHRDGRHAA